MTVRTHRVGQSGAAHSPSKGKTRDRARFVWQRGAPLWWNLLRFATRNRSD
ncbi:hypothetical protein [Sphingopyxis sp. Geo24]|uniref:hypothetical protein n=1 Tax=Sphingopyxis sp. Geo24 TaxID=340058 RepID=UPI0024AD1402|nr:hypothetical protein [Sphingopyxis sp. Geo24]